MSQQESPEGETNSDSGKKAERSGADSTGQKTGAEFCRLTPAQRESLLQEIRRVISSLDGDKPGDVFKRLCLLASTWDVDPEEFRKILVRAGFTASRASEIKVVLADNDQRLALLRGVSWKKCLKNARAERQSSLAKLAARLLKLTRLYTHRFPSGQVLGNSGWLLQRDELGQLRFLHVNQGESLEVLQRLPNFKIGE